MVPEDKEKLLRLMARYKKNMIEIKERVAVIRDLESVNSKGATFTGLLEVDIDLLYLQLRKISEIIMFSCVVANEAAEEKLNSCLRRGWELSKIKKSLAKINKDYFPYPVKFFDKEDGGVELEKYNKDDRIYLTEDELFSMYQAASDYLHAKRDYQYGSLSDRLDALNKGFCFASKITKLLSHHWVLINEEKQFAVMMSYGEKNDVQVVLMERDSVCVE